MVRYAKALMLNYCLQPFFNFNSGMMSRLGELGDKFENEWRIHRHCSSCIERV